jgi:Ran GTPase-activating protein (RanGAP) involved in mRNA processing and transport
MKNIKKEQHGNSYK